MLNEIKHNKKNVQPKFHGKTKHHYSSFIEIFLRHMSRTIVEKPVIL
jgi:hypothetical protein